MYTYDFPHPAVSADIVMLAGPADDRRVLLVRRGREPFAGQWALPGGFIEEGERIIDAARRELAEETGFEYGGALVHVGAFGDPGRDPRGWTIGIAFLGDAGEGVPGVEGGDDADEARWHPLESLPPLAFDHDEIVARAMECAGPGVCGEPSG